MKHTPLSLASNTLNPAAFADPDDVLQALNAVAIVIDRKNTIPILSNVRITGDAKQLDFTGTDLDMTLSVAIPARSTEIFDTTVPAALLRDIAKAGNDSIRRVRLQMIPDEPERRIRLNADGEQELDENGDPVWEDVPTNRPHYGKLHARFGDAEYDIQALPADDFPEATEIPDDSWVVEMSGSSFLNALDQTIPGMSAEETRYYLNGVYLHVPEKGLLAATATDGHRLYRQTITNAKGLYRPRKGVRGMAEMPGIIIPRKAVMVMHKLMSRHVPPAVTMIVADAAIQVTWDNYMLNTKLVDGTYPDYARVMPTKNDKKAVIDVNKLLAALKQVSVVSSERGRAVRLSFTKNRLELVVSNPDSGQARRTIPCNYESDPIEIGFNAQYLTEIANRAAPDKTDVVLHMDDAGSPTLITGSICGWSGVQMPMRV